MFTNRFSATRYMKVKRMGITEIFRRIWLFSANKITSFESVSKHPTQLIVKLNSSSWQKLGTIIFGQNHRKLTILATAKSTIALGTPKEFLRRVQLLCDTC